VGRKERNKEIECTRQLLDGSVAEKYGNRLDGSVASLFTVNRFLCPIFQGVQSDTSDPRHFGTIETGPKCPDSSALP